MLLLDRFAARTTSQLVPDAAPPTPKNPVKQHPSRRLAPRNMGLRVRNVPRRTGDGQTDLGKEMKLTDLSNPTTLANKSDKDLFDLIKTGKGQMTGEGDRMKTDEIWNLVTYMRGLAKR